ncbi:2-oxo acid dehydrogenase subunit E2 [Clostridium sp.]|jgi:pyruvate dehydrogenase E2 component (dihydrolipoamide acetyltransferase)|uniref:2-oxo acid dehydrogenase subunit E2 n=1 Tax=Clostridium sp. TaxID=1506 RepID=UPI00258ECAC0|nr:2-oxo acid dehydrogenase subunit E2 [Clostridium sp.]MDF2503623.1 pyruvate/2-oxoglutarate dehydrogenase complex, dihydrolipoamide acyltransferase component [Clostridium sp.]
MIYNNIKIKKSNTFDSKRKIVAHATRESWINIPHITYTYEPDITNFYEEFGILSKKLKSKEKKISFNTLMIKVIVEGLLAADDLNSYLEYNHEKCEGILHILDEINVAIPWILSDGSHITPSIINAGSMSLTDISDYILNLSNKIENSDIKEITGILSSGFSNEKPYLKGKEKEDYYNIPENERLTEEDFIYGTITFSNIGSLYKEQKGAFCLLEVIPPQVFAIGLSSVQEKPGVFIDENGDKQIGIRKTLPMCLAFDHRALDFSSIIPFLKKLDSIFDDPTIIHQW